MKLSLADHPPVRCDAMRAPVMPARVCVHHATRATQRPLACAACPVGAAVRKATGTPEPTPRALPESLRKQPRALTPCKRAGEGCADGATTRAGYCTSCAGVMRDAKRAGYVPVWGARRKLEGAAVDAANAALAALVARHGTLAAVGRMLDLSRACLCLVAQGTVSRKTAALLAEAAAKLGVRA